MLFFTELKFIKARNISNRHKSLILIFNLGGNYVIYSQIYVIIDLKFRLLLFRLSSSLKNDEFLITLELIIFNNMACITI